MNQKPRLNNKRHEVLRATIDHLFGEKDNEAIDQELNQYNEAITEMFEVDEANSEELRLVHFFNDEIFSPVKGPSPVLSLIRKRDVFLITMGKRAEHWEIIAISPPYEEMTF